MFCIPWWLFSAYTWHISLTYGSVWGAQRFFNVVSLRTQHKVSYHYQYNYLSPSNSHLINIKNDNPLYFLRHQGKIVGLHLFYLLRGVIAFINQLLTLKNKLLLYFGHRANCDIFSCGPKVLEVPWVYNRKYYIWSKKVKILTNMSKIWLNNTH